MWLLPPLLNVALIAFGLLVMLRYKKTGFCIAFFGIFSLMLLSTPEVAYQLTRLVEKYEYLEPSSIDTFKERQGLAIVVLGAGHYENAFEYDEPDLNSNAIRRMNYAIWISQQTGIPIMTTGGALLNYKRKHAEIMAHYAQRFGQEVRWKESKSRTTWENATFAADILIQEGYKDILLVTHSYHMQRSVRLFEKAGFSNVIPAPTEMASSMKIDGMGKWLPPSASSLNASSVAMHEILGILWYRFVEPKK